MSLSSAPNLDRVATESARSRLTQAGRPAPLPTRPRHAMTFPLVALQFSLRLPNHNFCPSSDVAARELCQLYVRRAPRFEEQIPDRQRERERPERIAAGRVAENYDEGGEICAALANRRRIPPSVSHAVSPVLHLSRAQLSPLLLLLITPSICLFHIPFHEVVPP